VAVAGLAAAALGAAAGLLFGGAVRLRSMLALAVASSMLVTIGARQAQDLVPGNATVLDWSATLVVALAGWCSRAGTGTSPCGCSCRAHWLSQRRQRRTPRYAQRNWCGVGPRSS